MQKRWFAVLSQQHFSLSKPVRMQPLVELQVRGQMGTTVLEI